jgi:pSer/pThr/pTyr-binding forkhead associated (FHA) protein
MSSSWNQWRHAVVDWEYCAIVDVAVILVSAAVGTGASILTAYVTYRLTARQDQRKWRAELAEKYALLATDQPRAAQALARQFAIGVLIIERGDTALREKIFIAPYIRMTAGRADDNEIVLPTSAASRHHFAISADGADAYVEDLGSNNGTFLNHSQVSGRKLLRTGDLIRVDNSFHIEFQSLTSSV